MAHDHPTKTLKTATLLAALTLGAGLLAPGFAKAGDTQDKVVQTFIDTLKAAGAKSVDRDGITGDDAKFTLSGVEIDTGDEANTASIDEITFINAKPTADGGITADEIDLNGLDFTTPKGDTSVETLKILGFTSPAPAKIRTAGQLHIDRLEATNVEGGDDANTITVSYLLLTSADYVDGLPHKGSFELKGLVIPVKADDPQMADVIALGYKELNIDASIKGNWDDKASRATLEWLTLTVKDAGDIRLSFALGGVTPDVLKTLAKSNGDVNQAIGALQALTLESATLKIENSSLFERFVAQQAKKQGTTKDELLHQATAMVPLLLTTIQNPAFEKKVADAVTAFVALPHSLTLKVAPPQPVPVAEIIGVAGAAPQTLPDILGADIAANQ